MGPQKSGGLLGGEWKAHRNDIRAFFFFFENLITIINNKQKYLNWIYIKNKIQNILNKPVYFVQNLCSKVKVCLNIKCVSYQTPMNPFPFNILHPKYVEIYGTIWRQIWSRVAANQMCVCFHLCDCTHTLIVVCACVWSPQNMNGLFFVFILQI